MTRTCDYPEDSRASTFVPRVYVVFDLEIHDPEGYEAYRLEGQASIRQFGGRGPSGGPAPRGVVGGVAGGWPTQRPGPPAVAPVGVARARVGAGREQGGPRQRPAA